MQRTINMEYVLHSITNSRTHTYLIIFFSQKDNPVYVIFAFYIGSAIYIHIYIIVITILHARLLTQFLTPLMLCVLILYISDGTYSLESTSNDRFFEKLFMAILFTLRVFVRNLLRRIAEEILFVFCFDVWPGARTLAFHLISQHTTYQTTADPPSNVFLSTISYFVNGNT